MAINIFCPKCKAQYKYQCECPNHSIMAWHRKNVFHSNKRYNGKTAWKVTQMNDDEYKEYYRNKNEKV